MLWLDHLPGSNLPNNLWQIYLAACDKSSSASSAI